MPPWSDSIREVIALSTKRFALRRLTLDDAPFILRLVNEPSWLRFIGDRGVRNLDDARRYLVEGPLRSYERNGFGLYRVDSKKDGKALGVCGLLRREGLDSVDIGFALFPEHCGGGVATEAGGAVVQEAKSLGFDRLLAITVPENDSSIRVLEKLGLEFERVIQLPSGSGASLQLFSRSL
jgi:ribosomal-protein-alanine N-acetyltransferase